jgi:hypothetical protein
MIAIEFLDRESMDLVLKHIPSQSNILLLQLHTIVSICLLLSSISCLTHILCISVYLSDARDPLSSPYPFYMLIETSGADSEHDKEVSRMKYQAIVTME